MAEHQLKTWPSEFAAIKRGEKTFEYRKLDRDFAVGDTLVLCKWDPGAKATLGYGAYVTPGGTPWHSADSADQQRVRVAHILYGGRFGVPEGYCVMSIALLGGAVGAVPGRPATDAGRDPGGHR